ncbi:phosphotransferase family protein [Sporosarcina contaminans]|uniref:Phosphotransferase family protein n=1 Tax=Sporosarcina contaminans TaxID=633403 RepID=A0ABW3TWX0_9BACL
MGNILQRIEWKERTEKLNDLLQKNVLSIEALEQGFEAEVMKLQNSDEEFVIKIWNKSANPNIGYQYFLLKALLERGIPVPKVFGWGWNKDGQQVLLTSFDGTQLTSFTENSMKEIGKILSTIHLIDAQGEFQFPTPDFIRHFFPDIHRHKDLEAILKTIMSAVKMRHDCLIHGDFHLQNIVEEGDRFTVIDWTNGQLGDSRYDFAWSRMLTKLYLSESLSVNFSMSYLEKHPIQMEEIKNFEAIAILRWLLLHRNGGVPIGNDTVERVLALISANSILKDHSVDEIQILG